MNKSESVKELFKALSVFQGELENVEKGKSGHGYKYATLGHCIDAAKAHLKANGLSVIQLLSSDDKGATIMETVLGHSSGEYISSVCIMPVAKLAGGGAGNPAQVMGASITYMRRYQYAAIIGLAQDDTDGAPKAKVNIEVESIVANREDHVWVSNNWGGVIKNQWNALSQDMTDILNNTFNEAQQ
ncbi:MAG: ERF family protein [Gammaproteobacteria bacterium]|nr:ERF family protein [Gammaproteobacteria bacterium]